MSNPATNKEWSTEDWSKFWKAKENPMQVNEYNKDLLEREKILFPDANTSYRVFVPLCGKSYDMEWLASKGHVVVGLDCSETVLKDFFSEHNLSFVEKTEGNFKVFQSSTPGHEITLYAGDIFELSQLSFQNCNAVWDYAGIVVIKPDDRAKYANAISCKLDSGANCLLGVFDFEGFNIPNGPAYQTTSGMIDKLYGNDFKINEIPDAVSDHVILGKIVAKKNFYHMVKKI